MFQYLLKGGYHYTRRQMSGNLNREIADAIETLKALGHRYDSYDDYSWEHRHFRPYLKEELRHLRLIQRLAKAHYAIKPGTVAEELELCYRHYWSPAEEEGATN